MSSRAWSNVPIGSLRGAGLLLAAGPVAARHQSEKLTVQARIGELCTVTAHRWISARGSISKSDTDAEGSIEIDCTAETALEVELDGGLSPDFSGARAMSDGESTLCSTFFTRTPHARSCGPQANG